jgi:hypothetical protein
MKADFFQHPQGHAKQRYAEILDYSQSVGASPEEYLCIL